ncbi:MAG: hypothetical protein PWQ48_1930 [Thermotogaceae bacterium]|nr:hypothetical protein [Thermotogaceae bacterium]
MIKIIKKVLMIVFIITALIPLGAPVFFTIIELIVHGKLLYDFFMPAELFFLTLIGGTGILVIGIINSQETRRLFIFLVLTTVNLFASQIYANLSGLAHGETELNILHIIILSVFVSFYHLFPLLVVVECFLMFKKISRISKLKE